MEHGRPEQPASAPRGQHPALHILKFFQIELANQSVDALRQTLDSVEQAEDTEILLHRQIPRERRINGCVIRVPQHFAAACRKIHPFDMD